MRETVQRGADLADYAGIMSKLNGDRARFHKDRKRKLHRRQRLHVLAAGLRKATEDKTSSRAASGGMLNEGGPLRTGD
jgi:hypothetical protein